MNEKPACGPERDPEFFADIDKVFAQYPEAARRVIDDDMLTFAVALKDKVVPVPEIAKKLTIKTGKNPGKNPSVASMYRALAEAKRPRRTTATRLVTEAGGTWSRYAPGDHSR
ncbi:hypothetical protein ACWGIU_23100 [Streptomyces sp. NPDC054840]